MSEDFVQAMLSPTSELQSPLGMSRDSNFAGHILTLDNTTLGRYVSAYEAAINISSPAPLFEWFKDRDLGYMLENRGPDAFQEFVSNIYDASKKVIAMRNSAKVDLEEKAIQSFKIPPSPHIAREEVVTKKTNKKLARTQAERAIKQAAVRKMFGSSLGSISSGDVSMGEQSVSSVASLGANTVAAIERRAQVAKENALKRIKAEAEVQKARAADKEANAEHLADLDLMQRTNRRKPFDWKKRYYRLVKKLKNKDWVRVNRVDAVQGYRKAVNRSRVNAKKFRAKYPPTKRRIIIKKTQVSRFRKKRRRFY